MANLLHISGILLLAAGVSLGSDQKSAKEPAPPPPPKVKAAAAAPNTGVPKAGVPKAGVPKAGVPKGNRIVSPSNVVTRLYRMTPEEREKAIEKWRPNQQEAARKNLAWFDSLPKEQRDMQLRRIDRFDQLPPERRTEVELLVKAAKELPTPRNALVRNALMRLQEMTDQQRENTLRRPAFRNRFSAEELRIITGLSDAWMGPQ